MIKNVIFVLLLICQSVVNAQIINVVPSFPAPGYMVVKDNLLFITQNDTGNIYKIDITDPNPTLQLVISTGNFFPTNPVIFENRMFYATSNAQEIYEIDISDSQPTPQLFLTGISSAQGLFLDGTTLYISEGTPSNKIVKTNILSSNPILEDVVSVNFPGQLWLEDDELFISAEYGEEILKININDSNPIPQLVTQTNGNIKDLLRYNDELWFSYPALDRISKFDSNNNIVQMIGGVDYPVGLLTIDNFLYFTFNQQISKVDIAELPLILNIGDLKKDNKLLIYPNPSSNFIQIKGKGLENTLNGKIFNSEGRIVKEVVFEKGKNISIVDLTEGVYFIQLENLGLIKFIKK